MPAAGDVVPEHLIVRAILLDHVQHVLDRAAGSDDGARGDALVLREVADFGDAARQGSVVGERDRRIEPAILSAT